ncbi:phosphonate ABC transporter, permease protein PhnE [Bosea sp. (in: a-proteobacteria)]|jgi:phosphonate transport system permease protein|uniref:phosphonate ABC transporter, permease protein PhnE n=1 Tax=Bosea sp. (in: a-proteobacteria) TaxID=1871050 RepID=UPI00086C5977|nr:phosphonate ABC transporter, permease protein PhnE [Bosea sp. (in: a-proteobacteria)]MBN9436671.1 phosphonate ABC transporter, permease protein PhnE [Bosea sp. (in: a-proteobacteria)]MBN9447106.1 phosphonate ABC transporter, permease protein PhnE [Bosea sp. (in: a-proteobacteria)]ODT44995.1 MAG: phosphonate ABC transporter, permease protein PhnE [Methylobacterium sp. SCN 67-24]
MSLALSAADRAALVARHKTAIDGSLKARIITLAVIGGLVGLFVYGLSTLETSFARFFAGFANLGTFVVLMLPPDPGSLARAVIFVKALFETIAIAFLGTILAAILAFPLGFLAAKNVVANRVVHFFARRSMDTVRGVDALIWALIWVNVVGLGPFAGMLAIMTSDLGAFGKLFSEAIEAADRKPVDGVASVGGGKLHEIRFGLIPQVLPVIASQVLYYIESNTRSSTIIGIVGAGGIGLYLAETIRTLEWQQVSFLILLILAAVTTIDFISGKLRHAIIGKRAI